MQVVLLTITATVDYVAPEGTGAARPALTAADSALTAVGACVDARTVPPDPSRVDLDAVLDALDGRRLIIHAGAADVSRVLRRLMRRGELTSVPTAVLPVQPMPFLDRFGITPELASAARIAVTGQCRAVGVLKDDSGNLVIDHAELWPWTGASLWTRAYVDDARLCDGEIRWLRVARGPSGGVRVSARASGRFARTRSLDGRAVTLACEDAAITSDGAGREQPRRKRIWWDEPDQWLLAVPARDV